MTPASHTALCVILPYARAAVFYQGSINTIAHTKTVTPSHIEHNYFYLLLYWYLFLICQIA